MRKIALLGWELGAGRGHLEGLRPVAVDLLKREWTVVVAVRDLRRGSAVFDSIEPSLRRHRFAIGQAPIFLHKAKTPRTTPGSLAECLANIGFADPALLRPVVETWSRLIEAVRPSVVVADYSPSLIAAARAAVPTIAIGNGWTVPPALNPVPHFAGVREARAASVFEVKICDAFEKATSGRWRPEGIWQILRGDKAFVCTSSLLDPYERQRDESVFWPAQMSKPEAFDGPKTIAATIYLPDSHPVLKSVLEAASTLSLPVHAFLAGATLSAPNNVRIHETKIDFASMLPRSRLLVHHGGMGTANWGLVAQVPQLIAPLDVEKLLIARAVARSRNGMILDPGMTTHQVANAMKQADRFTPSGNPSELFANDSPQSTVRLIVDACETAAAVLLPS